MAASGNATYTIDIAARITQYQEELKKMKQAADKLDIGAGIGKKIADALKTAEQQMNKFAQNTNIKVSNNNQIDRTVQQIDQLGESVSRIGGMLQQVTIGDLDLSKFDSSTQAVITRIRELEKIISSDYTAAIQNFVKSTPELTNFFNSLGQKFNARTASPEQFLGVLRERAEKAAEAFQQLDSKLQETDQKIVQLSQEKLDLQQSVFSQSSAANLATQVDQMMPPIEKLKQLLTKKLGGTSLDSQTVIDNFFTGLTPENFKKHFEKMLNDANLAIRQVTGKKRGSLTRSQLFEALGISGLDDPNAIASLTTNFVDQFKQFLDNLNASGTQGRINPADISAIKTLIDQGDWQKVVERTKQLITQGYKTNEALIAQKDKELEKALKDKSSLTAKQEAASAEAARTNQDFQNGLTQIQGVEEKQKDNIDKLGDSYKDLADKQQAAVDSQHRVGRSAQEAAASLRVTNSEVNAYREGLEKAKNAEQLIGRIQGLIQRWFSVYSVVRMVINAVKEVINTVKELDKTITDIAIVTNMSHSDLWGQMESYSDLAKQYGTSISGAYKVSQLYYQQGLQTNDVLGLTAETLKMARIAGMEYEDATNLMTNALRSFKMEMSEANRVTDVYAALAASSASSVEELAEAMSKTASSAQAVGSSFENTSAMMAVMIEATR